MISMAAILKGLDAATAAANLYARAAEAANNGDQQVAEEYLRQARERYDASRAAWDAA
jgi:hypothetical protein